MSTDIAADDLVEPLALDDYEKEDVVESPIENRVTHKQPEAGDLMVASEPKVDLNDSDTEDSDVEDKVQDQEALSLDSHNDFPSAPVGMPVSGGPEVEPEEILKTIVDEQVGKVLKEGYVENASNGMTALPLEEQVATEYIAPVSEAEIEVSAPAIVDEPVAVEVNEGMGFDPQPEAETKPELTEEEVAQEEADEKMLKEGPTVEPVFTPEPESKSTVVDDPFIF